MMPAVGPTNELRALMARGPVGRAWVYPEGRVDRTLHVGGMAQ